MRSYLPALFLCVCFLAAAQAEPGPAGFSSVQEAVAAAKGAPVFLPAGEWRISEPVVFRGAGGGLHGAATGDEVLGPLDPQHLLVAQR